MHLGKQFFAGAQIPELHCCIRGRWHISELHMCKNAGQSNVDSHMSIQYEVFTLSMDRTTRC